MVGKQTEQSTTRFPGFGKPANPPRASRWVLSLLASLLCCTASAATTLFTEGFEGSFPPAGWTETSIDQSDTYAFNGTYSAKFSANSDELITPAISNATTFIFWSYTTSADPQIVVEHALSPSGPWTEFPESPFSGDTEQWNGRWVTLTNSQPVYIRLQKNGTGSLYIDDAAAENDNTPSTNNPPVFASIGNQSVTVSNALNFTVSATDIDNDPIILSASNLPPGAVFNTVTNAGTVSNTFTWAVAAPVGSYTPVFYAHDGSTTVSETVTITVQEPPVLMITEVADPAGTGGGDYRFVELYNAGSSPVILEGGPWFLSKQVNGGTWSDVPLAGTIPAGETFVIAYSAAKFQEAYGFAPDESDGDISGTGDDAYFLYSGGDHTSGTLVDIYGEFDTDGTGTTWEYTDSRALRNSSASGPSATWIASEWTIIEGATTSDMDPGAAYNVPPILSPIGNKGGLEGRSISFPISATDLTDGDAISFSATNLPPGAVFTGNTFIWETAAPAGQYPVTFSATDKDGSDSETVTITVIEKPLLMISEIADPDGDGADVYRFVELYNAGTNSLNPAADGWHLSKQVNGGTWYDIELTNQIAASGTWVLAGSAPDFATAYGFAPDQENSTISGNGDDAWFLFYGGDHETGILIDIYGEFDTDGTDTAWDYTDGRAVRNETVLEPNSVWTAEEWTITSGATTNNMTPGEHGPLPVFQGLENQFVFLGDDLSPIVTAVNTVKTDVITLYAGNLPDGAAFPTNTATDSVSSLLSWSSPTAGVYTVTFAAQGAAGTRTRQIRVTVSATDAIDGRFDGWRSGTIVKLDNGQFWRNTGGVGPSVSYNNPGVTVTNLSGTRRMFVDGVKSYTTVERIDIVESAVESTFSGLHNGNVVELADGTVWRQISYENISSSADPVTAWRWTENAKTYLRFVDRDNLAIGTCEVTAAAPPSGPAVTQIDGWFRGWEKDRIFALANGGFWQQTTANSSIDTLFRPAATLTNYLGTGTWRLYIDGAAAPGYVEVRQLTGVIRTAIDGTFYGFGGGSFFRLQNGQWWRQTSSDTSASIRSNPEVFLWNSTLQLPDEGRAVSVEQLAVLAESTITNLFSGLRYAKIHRLANGDEWLQISFENSVAANVPAAMLWTENSSIRLLVRDASDRQIGICTVVDPNADDDGDGVSNADESVAGTSLSDRNDFFMIADITQNAQGRAVLRWVPVPGRTYTVEWTPSLLQSFQPLETLTDWTQDSWTDTVNPPGSGGFYRIRVQLSP